MITVKYGQLREPEFLAVTQRIYRAKMAFRTAKRLSEIFRELEKELIEVNKQADKLRVEHMTEAEHPGSFKALPGHESKVLEFLETVVEIQKPRITAQELFNVELSPSEVDLLEGLIDVE